MEENQKLFDMCVQNYNKQKEQEQTELEGKQKRWEELERAAMANAREILREGADDGGGGDARLS